MKRREFKLIGCPMQVFEVKLFELSRLTSSREVFELHTGRNGKN